MNDDSLENPSIGIPSGQPQSQIAKINIQACGHNPTKSSKDRNFTLWDSCCSQQAPWSIAKAQGMIH